MSPTGEPLLELRGISKAFGKNTVLSDIDLRIDSGEVVALLGENGAGKSTLIKVLNGVHAPDSGQVLLSGEEISFSSPVQAIDRGIATVHQESSLVPSLDIAANLLLGQERARTGGRVWLHERKLRDAARAALAETGFELPLRRLSGELSVGERQMVEIARALASASTILILDEPTAALSAHEVQQLFAAIRRATSNGLAVFLVTHRLDEVLQITDRVVVLRDGKVAGNVPTVDATEHTLVSMMLGREIDTMFPDRVAPVGSKIVLNVHQLITGTNAPISFTVGAGEIVGFTGIVGAGQREVARAIFGADPIRGGRIDLNGVALHPGLPVRAVKAGIAYVSGDRRADGVIPNLTVEQSLVVTELRRESPFGFVRGGKLRRVAADLRCRFSVKAASLSSSILELSGGNQQKVLIARWLNQRPALLILDDPTLGVDVGSKSEIYELIGQLAAAGTAVLLVSSESQEVLGLSDRVVVFRNGQAAAELTGADLTEDAILRHALGVAHVEDKGA